MEFCEYKRLHNRMCRHEFCSDCKLRFGNNGTDLECHLFEDEHPIDAEKVVKQWNDEHPMKTKKEYLKDILPDIVVDENGYPKSCPQKLGLSKGHCGKMACYECRHLVYDEEVLYDNQ